MDEYPTYDEWIKMFDMDTDTPGYEKNWSRLMDIASGMGER